MRATNLVYKLCASCAVLFFLIIFISKLTSFPNIDEVAHLPSGVSHLRFERFDLYRVNPPLVRTLAAIPSFLANTDYDWCRYNSFVGSRPEFLIGIKRLQDRKKAVRADFIAARAICVLHVVLLMYVLTRWVARVFQSGIVVLFYLCFCPNLLAQSPTILPDVGSVAFGVLTCYVFWLYLQQPNYEMALYCGLSLGLAMLTKLTWLTALFTLPVTVLLSAWLYRSYIPHRRLWNRIIDFGLIYLVALFTLNAGYLFEDSCLPLGDYEFCSKALGAAEDGTHGNRFKDSAFGSIPLPFPRNYILGIDYLKHEVEMKQWSFLMGEWRLGSWWYYYVCTTLFKTPEATLIAAALGLITLAYSCTRRGASHGVGSSSAKICTDRDTLTMTSTPEAPNQAPNQSAINEHYQCAVTSLLVLGIPALMAVVSISYQGGFNHHHRYVLMIYPPMFMLAASLFDPIYKSKFPRFAGFVLTCFMIASSLTVFPHYISYFNTSCGGPKNGWKLLGHSNIDWGQGVGYVEEWIQKHPECRPLSVNLDYFMLGSNLFELVDEQHPPLMPKGASIDEVRATITETQWWIISVKTLYNKPDEPGLEYLQQLEPTDKIAYAYHVYRIDPLPDD